MTKIKQEIINTYWRHLLYYRDAITITSDHNFLYGLSADVGVIQLDEVGHDHQFYISSHAFDLEDFCFESFFDEKIHFYYSHTADDEVIQLLRDYWILTTYIKLKPADKVFIIVHMAQSLDGKVSTAVGNSKWIGNQENLIHAHRLRAIVDGVLVGGNTASADLPKLTVRHVEGNNPVRIIYSDNFDNYKNLNNDVDQKTINIRSLPAIKPSSDVVTEYEFYDKTKNNYLSNVLKGLNNRGIQSILVEGGPTMASSFLAEDLVDIVQLHVAPLIMNHAYYSQKGDAQMITGIPHLQNAISHTPTLKRRSSAPIPTAHGTFDTIAYSHSVQEKMPHLVLLNDSTDLNDAVNVRIHSECITGDLFGSYRCECGEQLDKAMEYVSKNGGLIIYLRQEGRGIGIINKLHAYTKQDEGYNTADANKVLGFGYDDRTYQDAVDILKDLGIKKINLLTNNTDKINAIANSEIDVAERIPVEVQPKKENIDYLRTKKEFFGHKLHKI